MLLLQTFGGLTLSDATTHTPIGAPRRKPLALLALVAEGRHRGVEREWIMAMLWPELTEARARRALSQTLYALRRELSADVLLDNPRLVLDPTRIAVDASAFEELARPGRGARELERAVAAYTGPFLDGVAFDGCIEFDQWASGVRAAYARAYQGALRELARLAAEHGDQTVAIAWLERMTREFPLDSDAASALAAAYAACGRSGQAASLLRSHMATLESELGVNPPAAIVAVAERLRAEAPPLETVSRVVGSTASGSAGVPSAAAWPSWPRRVTAATVALIARLGGRRHLLRWSTAAAAVAALAAAGLFVRTEVRRSRSLGDVSEERQRTLGPRPANLREPVLLVFRPPSSGDSVVDAALRRSFSISEYVMARTFPGRIIGTDSVAALLRAIRARTKVAVTETEEVHELLRVTGAAAAVGMNSMLYDDSIRINPWIARRTTYRDHRWVMRPVEHLPGPPGERGIWVREDPMRLVHFGPPIDGVEMVHFAGIVLPATALPMQIHLAENPPLFRIITSMTTCERHRDPEMPGRPERFRSPWCWRWWGKLQLADDDGQGYSFTRSRGIPPAAVPVSPNRVGRAVNGR
jgi:DNA-binding SARP family transcriptional activator